MTGVRSFKGWVKSTMSTAPLASASTSAPMGDVVGSPLILAPSLSSCTSCAVASLVSAERLLEPLGPYLGIDLRVDHQWPITSPQPVFDRCEVALLANYDTLSPSRTRERGEVRIREASDVHWLTLRPEVVHLRPVGRVVVDHDEHRQAVAGACLQLAQSHKGAAVAYGRHAEPIRSRHRGPDTAGQTQTHRLKGVRENKAPVVGHREVHGRVAEEVPGVSRDGALRRQHIVERYAEGTRVDVIDGALILVGLVARAPPGDLAREGFVAKSLPFYVAALEFVQDGLRGRGRVPDYADIHAMECSDYLSVQVHLRHARIGREEPAVAHGPVIQGGAEGEHDVRLREQFEGE